MKDVVFAACGAVALSVSASARGDLLAPVFQEHRLESMIEVGGEQEDASIDVHVDGEFLGVDFPLGVEVLGGAGAGFGHAWQEVEFEFNGANFARITASGGASSSVALSGGGEGANGFGDTRSEFIIGFELLEPSMVRVNGFISASGEPGDESGASAQFFLSGVFGEDVNSGDDTSLINLDLGEELLDPGVYELVVELDAEAQAQSFGQVPSLAGFADAGFEVQVELTNVNPTPGTGVVLAIAGLAACRRRRGA